MPIPGICQIANQHTPICKLQSKPILDKLTRVLVQVELESGDVQLPLPASLNKCSSDNNKNTSIDCSTNSNNGVARGCFVSTSGPLAGECAFTTQ